MTDPLIAIAGSADQRRTDYQPPLRNLEVVKTAAEQLGRELANAGYRIMVYSSDPGFIEADVVRGYIPSNRAKPVSIQVRYPQVVGAKPRPEFPEEATHPDLFDVRTDTPGNWEVSFYASLKDADGILLLGGARSTLAAGLVAQVYRVPLVAVAAFGGSAQTVCSLTVSNLATREERRLMARDRWYDDSAAKLVKVFGNQRQRLLDEQEAQRRAEAHKKGEARNRAVAAAVCFAGAVALMLLAAFWPSPHWLPFAILFFSTPMLAGASGGLVRTFVMANTTSADDLTYSAVGAITLGVIAGGIAAILFVLAQMASNPDIRNLDQGIPSGLHLLVIFGLVIGFIGGFTLDAVFGKLRRTDVVNVDTVAAPKP